MELAAQGEQVRLQGFKVFIHGLGFPMVCVPLACSYKRLHSFPGEEAWIG